jgi:hypothetical protein
MGFIEQFFKRKKAIKAEDVDSFIAQKIEENQNLDYKHIQAYHKIDKLSCHVASFANSTGGLIILGVSQDEIKDKKGKIIKIYPKKITWGEVSLDKETLENKLLSAIQPPISNLVIKPVRNEKHQVIFLIDIPKSDFAPHMSPDHRYNTRTNFRKRAMEHYEVTNLFKTNWTLKEKMVEKIYEPLSEFLEKHIKQLGECLCPSSHELKSILSRTYYKTQMPFELLEEIDYYIDQIEELKKKECFAREAIRDIASKNIHDYLKEKHGDSSTERINFGDIKILTSSERSSPVDFDTHLVYKLLLTNKKIQTYIDEKYWWCVYEKVRILRGSKQYDVNLNDFDELVWNKCLKEASNNSYIKDMKQKAKTLKSEAWHLLEKITQ